MNWKTEPFESLYLSPSRNGIYKTKEYHGSGTKIVNMGELFGYEFISNQDMKRVELTDSELNKSVLIDGDLLFGRRSLVESGAGKCSIVTSPTEPLTFESSIIRVRLDSSKCNPLFYYYWFKSHAGSTCIRAIVSGTNVKGIKGSDLKKILVATPERHIQDSIASKLKVYDDLITNNHRRIELLENSAHLLFEEWFISFRFPGFEDTDFIEKTPKLWERKKLPEIIQVNPKTNAKQQRITYVPMSALSETDMSANTTKFEQRTKHTNIKFTKNDVLLARITPCLENGKTGFAYFLQKNEVACGSTEFIVLRGKKVSPLFTYCLSRSYTFRENAIKSMTGSSGRQRVQINSINEYIISLPPPNILNQFDQFVGHSFDQIQVLMLQNDFLQKAKELLLNKLMNTESVFK